MSMHALEISQTNDLVVDQKSEMVTNENSGETSIHELEISQTNDLNVNQEPTDDEQNDDKQNDDEQNDDEQNDDEQERESESTEEEESTEDEDDIETKRKNEIVAKIKVDFPQCFLSDDKIYELEMCHLQIMEKLAKLKSEVPGIDMMSDSDLLFLVTSKYSTNNYSPNSNKMRENLIKNISDVLQEVIDEKLGTIENIIGKLHLNCAKNILTNPDRNIMFLNFEDDTAKAVLQVDEKYLNIIKQWYDDSDLFIDFENTDVYIPHNIEISNLEKILFQDIYCKNKNEYLNNYIPLAVNNIISETRIKNFEKTFFIKNTKDSKYTKLIATNDKILNGSTPELDRIFGTRARLPMSISSKYIDGFDGFGNLDECFGLSSTPITKLAVGNPSSLAKSNDNIYNRKPTQNSIISVMGITIPESILNNSKLNKNGPKNYSCSSDDYSALAETPIPKNIMDALESNDFPLGNNYTSEILPNNHFGSVHNFECDQNHWENNDFSFSDSIQSNTIEGYNNYNYNYAKVLDNTISDTQRCISSMFVLINNKYLQTLTITNPSPDVIFVINNHPEFGFIKLFDITTANKDISNFIEQQFNKTNFNTIEELNKKLQIAAQYIEFSNTHFNTTVEANDEESQIKAFLDYNYTINSDINNRIRATILYDLIVGSSFVCIESDKLPGFKLRLSKYLKRMGLQKKRYNDGFYYYGITKKELKQLSYDELLELRKKEVQPIYTKMHEQIENTKKNGKIKNIENLNKIREQVENVRASQMKNGLISQMENGRTTQIKFDRM